VDDGAAITMSAASPLSAAAHPFFPGETSMGRSMQLRWLDSGDEEMVDYSFTPSPQPASYRDAVLRSPSSSEPLRPRQRLGRPGCGRLLWVLLSPPTPPPHRHRRRLSRRVRHRRAPLLRAAVPPARPALPELAPNCCRPLVDADGFQEVLPRAARRRLRRDGSSSSCHRHRTGRIQGRNQDLIMGAEQ